MLQPTSEKVQVKASHQSNFFPSYLEIIVSCRYVQKMSLEKVVRLKQSPILQTVNVNIKRL